MGHEHDHQAGVEGVVLDIGGDLGALILYTRPEYAGREIELSREGDPDGDRIHTAIHERVVGGRLVHAGVFPGLPAGRYRIWAPEPGLQDRVTIAGGEVAVVDWRSLEGPAQ